MRPVCPNSSPDSSPGSNAVGTLAFTANGLRVRGNIESVQPLTFVLVPQPRLKRGLENARWRGSTRFCGTCNSRCPARIRSRVSTSTAAARRPAAGPSPTLPRKRASSPLPSGGTCHFVRRRRRLRVSTGMPLRQGRAPSGDLCPAWTPIYQFRRHAYRVGGLPTQQSAHSQSMQAPR